MNQSRQDKYGHIMFDLETLDNKNTSSILSIGAVEFNLHTGEIGETLYVRVDLQSCIDEGLTIVLILLCGGYVNQMKLEHVFMVQVEFN